MISIIIPMFNCEKHIERCIRSVQAQSFKDFELIIVDDGSTDGGGAICYKFASADDRIRVLHKENGGVSSARNMGLDIAEGNYITFMDADDFVPADYLKELFAAVNNVDISVCDIACLRNGKETCRFTLNKRAMTSTEATELLLSRKKINSGPCGKLFSREVIGKTRFPIMKAYEDMLFVLEVFDKATGISCTDKTEYVYDTGTGGAMTEYAKRPTTDVVTMSERVFEYLDSKRDEFSDVPEYTALSHLMQHAREINRVAEKTIEQKHLLRAIINCFSCNRKRIRKNKAFSKKERLVYLAASYNLNIKGRPGRICK